MNCLSNSATASPFFTREPGLAASCSTRPKSPPPPPPPKPPPPPPPPPPPGLLPMPINWPAVEPSSDPEDPELREGVLDRRAGVVGRAIRDVAERIAFEPPGLGIPLVEETVGSLPAAPPLEEVPPPDEDDPPPP